MKKLFATSLILVMLFFSGCNSYYNHIIEADYSYEGNFNRYKTYDFVQNERFEGTPQHKELIEKYLSQNLESWGYRRKDKKPNLVIFYSLFFEDMSFTGYNQPNFEQWVKWNFPNDIIAESQDSVFNVEEYLDAYNKKGYQNEDYSQVKFDMKEGTLLISLYDRRMDKTIWQGYASGVMGDNQFDNDRFIRHIVIRIMDKYRVLAVGTI